MKTIIVDDEPGAIKLMEEYIRHFSKLEVVGTFRNGLKAIEYIRSHPVDLVFLDIDMPHISGLSLSKMLPRGIHLVFTTAYSEYAVESYEVGARDYLLKPISLDRFTQTVGKLLSKNTVGAYQDQHFRIAVKSGTDTHWIDLDDLLFLQKDGNYMTYHTSDRQVLARATVSEALVDLPDRFVRCHKSYIVNLDKITKLSPHELTIQSTVIPIGEVYKVALLDRLR